MGQIIDLQVLIKYYEELHKIIDSYYPEKITRENVMDYNFTFDYKHPKWVRAHFPLVLIHYRKKAGKLRDSKSLKVMHQNNNNVLTQLICHADCWGHHYRKNKHKGFPDIVAAYTMKWEDVSHLYGDKVKPKKYKDFIEMANVETPGDIKVKAMAEVLNEHYPCDSRGQLKMI